ncbi:MAG TPA: carbonic anhydrase [Rhizomicrobium sp.]|nr:carbonic anhydrase [Rhizomicrobium sp.]
MDRLIRGYRQFRKTRWPAERKRYEQTAAKGQKPEYLIIACSDSRSDPGTIFGAHPGEFFTVRNIAALVPPFDATNGLFGTRSAIAYAVLALNVRNIVVMGHAQCGGVAAALHPETAHGIPFVAEWVELAKPAVAHAHVHEHGQDKNADAERETVKLSVERLKEYPFIAERLREKKIAVDGTRFNIATGKLELLDQHTGKFNEIAKPGILEQLFG